MIGNLIYIYIVLDLMYRHKHDKILLNAFLTNGKQPGIYETYLTAVTESNEQNVNGKFRF